MAAAYNAERKAGTATTNGSGVATFQLATDATAGNTLIIVVLGGKLNAISDNVGSNTYAIDLSGTASAGTPRAGGIVSSFQTVALTTAATISVTVDVTSTQIAFWVEEFTGNYSVFDKSTTSTGSNSTTLPTGTSAATTAADEFAVAVWTSGVAGNTLTKNASYTAFTTGQQASNGAANTAYRLLVATGTQNADGTASAKSNSWNGLATYKAVAGTTYTKAGFAKEGA